MNAPASSATKPRALVPGARVALVAPAGPVDPERIEASEDRCRALGLEPVVSPAASARSGFLAGTDEERLRDLQAAFDDPEIDAVWALRGGYGTLRILPRLDLGRQKRDPIPFIGFSDNTSIHALHAVLGVISFHGPHPGAAFPSEAEAAFRRVLFSAEPPGLLPLRAEDPAPRTLVPGRVEAPLVGGNLAILAAMCGTPWAPSARGRILFLEDVGEPPYRVDRMLWQLERAGVTEGVAGLAFGRFTGGTEDNGENGPGDAAEDGRDEGREDGGRSARGGVNAVLAEFAERLGVPTVTDLPIGHVEHNWTLPVGGTAVLDAGAGVLRLSRAAVQDA